MSVYILQKEETDWFGRKTCYYIHDDFDNGNHSIVTTRYEAEAKRYYSSDDASKMACRIINVYGCVCRVIRIDSQGGQHGTVEIEKVGNGRMAERYTQT